MHFIGHTRFSIFEPQSSSWRMTRATNEGSFHKYREDLFSEERLSTRSNVFFKHTLPLLDRAKGDHDLLHVVSYSEELPEKYQVLLYSAAEKYPWLVLDKRTAENRKGTTLNTFVKRRFGPGVIYGSYRLDDDDILGINYFDQVAPYVKPEFVKMVVSLGLGVLAFYDEGRFVNPRLEHRPKIALGLLKICEYTHAGEFIAPQNIAHPRTDLKNAMILDSREVSFVHSMHMTQDSGVDKPADDFSKRMRNYNRLPEVPTEVILTDNFPSVPFVDDTGFLSSY